jgi:hypothetical protein
MMWLCLVWGWQPPQTASHIHIIHTKCLSTLICYPKAYGSSLTQLILPYMAQILAFWVTYGIKWSNYVMFEADSHLKLIPTSILDIYKVFEHIDMLSISIQYHPYTVIPTLLFLDLGFWVTCWVKWCDYVMVEADSQLKLLHTSILGICKVFEHIDMLSICIW